MSKKIDVYLFRGTGEQLGSSMVWTVADKLDPNRYNIIEIDYPATIGPIGGRLAGTSLNESVEIAVDKAINRMVNSDKIGIISYSLGAIASTRLLERLAAAEVTYSSGNLIEPLFAVQIANPARNENDSALGLGRGSGIHSSHLAFPKDTFNLEIANGYDMITSSDKNSPNRLLSDVISPFSFMQLAQTGSANAQKALMNVQKQDKFSWLHINRYVKALEDIGGYLIPFGWPLRTQHTLYNLEIMPGTGMTWTDYAVTQITDRWG